MDELNDFAIDDIRKKLKESMLGYSKDDILKFLNRNPAACFVLSIFIIKQIDANKGTESAQLSQKSLCDIGLSREQACNILKRLHKLDLLDKTKRNHNNKENVWCVNKCAFNFLFDNLTFINSVAERYIKKTQKNR